MHTASLSLFLSFCLRRGTFFFDTERNIAIARASAPKHADIPVGLLHFYIFIASRIVLASAGTPTSFATKIRDIEFACHPSAVYVPPSLPRSFVDQRIDSFVSKNASSFVYRCLRRSNERPRSSSRTGGTTRHNGEIAVLSTVRLFFFSLKRKEGERERRHGADKGGEWVSMQGSSR